MKYLTIIITFLESVMVMVKSFVKKRQERKRLAEKKKVDDFKIETEKNVNDGEIDDINSKLKF